MASSTHAYEVEFKYRLVRNEQNPADYISRPPQTTPTRENTGEEYIAFLAKCGVPKAMTQDEVRSETQRDPQLQKVMQAVQTGQWRGDISDFTRFKDEISVHDGLVLRGHRLILPQSLQNQAINIAHRSHQGIVKTKHNSFVFSGVISFTFILQVAGLWSLPTSATGAALENCINFQNLWSISIKFI